MDMCCECTGCKCQCMCEPRTGLNMRKQSWKSAVMLPYISHVYASGTCSSSCIQSVAVPCARYLQSHDEPDV